MGSKPKAKVCGRGDVNLVVTTGENVCKSLFKNVLLVQKI